MMSPRTLRLATLLLLGLLGVSTSACGPGPAGFGSVPPQVRPIGQAHSLEHQMAELVNELRSAHDLHPLVYDEALADVGRAHSDDMHRHEFFEHESPNTGSADSRLIRAGYAFRTARENLALADDLNGAIEGLMNSPGHRDNLLARDVTRLGVGIVRGSGKWGPNLLYITQVFAKPVQLVDPHTARRDIIARLNRARGEADEELLQEDGALAHKVDELARGLDSAPSQNELSAMGAALAQLVETSPNSAGGIEVTVQIMLDPEDLTLPERIREPSVFSFALSVVQLQETNRPPQLLLLLVLLYR